MKKFIALVAFCLMMLLSVPAFAGAHMIPHGDDRAKIGINHLRITAFDRECDGNAVWAYAVYRDATGEAGAYGVQDANGCDPGGTQRNVMAGADALRICEVVDSNTRSCADYAIRD